MKQIAKWTLLCILLTAVGFGATLLVAHRDQAARTLVAMLAPARAPQAAVEVLPEADPLALQPISAETLLAAETTVGTLAAADPAPQAQVPVGSAALTAVGTVELTQPRQVVLEAGGRIDTIDVVEGDAVAAGDVLVSLDTTYLDWAVEHAEIGFETASINF